MHSFGITGPQHVDDRWVVRYRDPHTGRIRRKSFRDESEALDYARDLHEHRSQLAQRLRDQISDLYAMLDRVNAPQWIALDDPSSGIARRVSKLSHRLDSLEGESPPLLRTQRT